MKRATAHGKVLIMVFAILSCVPRAALQSTWLESTSVTLSETQIATLERYEPALRATLTRVTVQAITYLSDGLRIKGYLVAPRHGTHLPCVIYNRGGNRDFGKWTDESVALELAKIASWGYVVVASQYRGSAGGEGQDEFGGAEVNDVLTLITLLESYPQADASRIGMYGWSRGGMMTYLALTRTDRVCAAVIGAGLADSFDTIQRRPTMEHQVYAQLVPQWSTARDQALEARSPLHWPAKLSKRTPILLLHGSADWRVHPSQTFRMAAALYAVQHPFRFVFFEGGDHGLTEYREEVDRLARDWFERYVRHQQRWPSLESHGP
jgi:dipeptidyl aminopeptidase/acylaminoacyl peptidase